MHSLCCIAPVPMDKDGKGGGKMFPTSSEPNSPQGLVSDRQNASFVSSDHIGGSVVNSSRSMAASAPLPPLPPSAKQGGAATGAAHGSDVHDRDAADVPPGGAGKVFTVTPEGGMKTATNFSGELFQVVDTKAGASPQGSALTDNVAGILYKWVNYGKGWRPRWFALKDGVFSYYKVHGHGKATLNDNRFKNFRIIGEETQKLTKKSHKPLHPHMHLHSVDPSQFRASGEIHLKVWNQRERAVISGSALLRCIIRQVQRLLEYFGDRIAVLRGKSQSCKDYFVIA
jgi:hypothetical protein